MTGAWVGIPYRINGDPPEAADCYTLCRAFARAELGQLWPRYFYEAGSLVRDANSLLVTEMAGHGPWSRVETPEPGDLIAIRIRAVVSHCGIYLGAGDMLHTLAGRESCIERVENWRESVAGYFRWNKGA